MSKKLNELRAFVNQIRYPENGLPRLRISLRQLEKEIAESYGYSPYILKSVLNAIINFGLIFEDTPQVYSFVKPQPEPEPDVVPEGKAEEHLDALLPGSDG